MPSTKKNIISSTTRSSGAGLSTARRSDDSTIDLDDSQSSDMADVKVVLDKVMKGVNDAHEKRRKKLLQDRDIALASHKSRMSELESDHYKKLTELRHKKLSRLRALAKQKLELEQSIASSLQTVNKALRAASHEIKAACDGRQVRVEEAKEGQQ